MIYLASHLLIAGACGVRILIRRHRQPESRAAWLAVVMAVPLLGALIYLLVGEIRVGQKRLRRFRQSWDSLPRPEAAPGWDAAANLAGEPGRAAPLFRVGTSISGYTAVGGNRASMAADSGSAIEAMISDIDQASEHVHALFYVWLNDQNGTRMAEAMQRAARRGVTCRVLVDDLGSRDLIRSPLWQEMESAGVHLIRALRIGNPLLRIFIGRIDLRNHRKLLLIDNRIAHCGSQNCADAAFRPKARYAPWVDAVMRFEGPIARQNQHLFAWDWMGNGGEDLSSLMVQPMPPAQPGFTAQVVGTGPTLRHSAMSELFETLIYAAQHELTITTPYYVPNAGLQSALCAAANRGVDTTIILPARNDDFAVAATSRSYYADLLEAGVKIHEFLPGLLHTKSVIVDGEVTLIGSANMDRRSVDLNYENNVLLQDRSTTSLMRARQQEYLASSRRITREEVAAWSIARRIWNNALAIVGPLL